MTEPIGYKLKGNIENPFLSNNLTIKEIESKEIIKIVVNVETKKIFFITDAPEIILEFPIEIGKKGFSKEGEGFDGDEKTPKNKSCCVQFIRKPKEICEAVFTQDERDPPICLGPCFICFDIKYKNKLRGIGIHGSSYNELRVTSGCIRMYNDDILSIREKIKKGIPVEIS